MDSITMRKTIAADISLSLADDGAISLILATSTTAAPAAGLPASWRTEADVLDGVNASAGRRVAGDRAGQTAAEMKAAVLRSCAAELEDALGLTEASHAGT